MTRHFMRKDFSDPAEPNTNIRRGLYLSVWLWKFQRVFMMILNAKSWSSFMKSESIEGIFICHLQSKIWEILFHQSLPKSSGYWLNISHQSWSGVQSSIHTSLCGPSEFGFGRIGSIYSGWTMSSSGELLFCAKSSCIIFSLDCFTSALTKLRQVSGSKKYVNFSNHDLSSSLISEKALQFEKCKVRIDLQSFSFMAKKLE